MTKMMKLSMVLFAAAGIAAAQQASAKNLGPVSCSVSIDYLINNVVRAPYSNDFIVEPGVTYEHDFSSAIRFRVFNAATALDENNDTVVSISYFNDVGVFTSVDLTTFVKLKGNREATTAGNHTFFASQGITGAHETRYSLTCALARN